jgi:maltose alpha-D-glucosyltransferase/alpha-amylase
MADVETFLAEAHRHGIRVITELVINHTSDQHPWFQAARHAPARSAKRDFYVWSDTPERYKEARVIFSDAEASNWTWDPVAGAYYWHRFFHHQPDLNFDNPHVRQAVLKVMRFWFDKGVDGLRLDAIAHLFERDGTSCDNLPETHALLKWLRADMEARYEDRILLAEANQPTAVLREYFGNADECHMAFHFPLVARLFAAFADERAAPIVDVVADAAQIPEPCQWALFLRNHDDLSLSALGPDENARLMRIYAPQSRMRLHGGIRRRLAPMLGHDRRRIELAHALLCSLPGTPVIYYGDEIGMTDRLDLDDRDGLRTAMQWDASPSGGFSTLAAPTIPVNDDPSFGFSAINVASSWQNGKTRLHESGRTESLLERMMQLLHARRAHPAFGRGGITFLSTDCPAVLAFLRDDASERLLALFNLSREKQQATLVAALEPVVFLTGSVDVPEIGTMPSDFVPVALPPYSWGWWRLSEGSAGSSGQRD